VRAELSRGFSAVTKPQRRVAAQRLIGTGVDIRVDAADHHVVQRHRPVVEDPAADSTDSVTQG
jgi:hypothetical protein